MERSFADEVKPLVLEDDMKSETAFDPVAFATAGPGHGR